MSDERGACIREERATREALGLCGDGKALSPGRGIAWCGRRLVGWTFEDADHAFQSLSQPRTGQISDEDD